MVENNVCQKYSYPSSFIHITTNFQCMLLKLYVTDQHKTTLRIKLSLTGETCQMGNLKHVDLH